MRRIGKENTAARGAVLTAVFALFCLVAPVGRAHPPSAVPERSARTPIASANFAVADFDGDRKPDLATVEMERGASSGDARYSIRFTLATGDTQVFGVTAPAGGLQIVARDVNGDHALDLLVSSAWQHKQIAVFLNDGHGNFSLASAGGFSASSWADEGQWNSESVPQGDNVLLLRCQPSPDARQQTGRCKSACRQVGLTNVASFRDASDLLLFSLPGRAPPADFHQA